MGLKDVGSLDALQGYLLTSPDALHVLFVYADWDAPSQPGGQMHTVTEKLAELHPGVHFAKLNADDGGDVAEALSVEAVPTFLFFKKTAVLDKLEGADAAELTKRVERLQAAPAAESAASAIPQAMRDLQSRLQALVTANHVMLFMKGSPDAPRCKFSRRAVELLQEAGATFGSFDILSSEAVRQGLKEWSNWPTYPQLYIAGQLVGGVDILQELKDSGELATMLPKPAAPAAASSSSSSSSNSSAGAATTASSSVDGPALAADGSVRPEVEARLRALMASAPAVLFMKGTPASPACGFSDRIVKLLTGAGVAFKSHDILSDPQAREGLKVLNAWPTFPQLVVHGKLVGGLDIIKEMAEDTTEPLAAQLGLPVVEPLATRLQKLVSSARMMLFMKGSHATGAKCGFSAEALRVIESAGLDVAAAAAMTGADGTPLFGSFDILSDDEVRQGLKEWANWPTYPQLYVDGQLVGGLDIMKEMQEAGELRALLLGHD